MITDWETNYTDLQADDFGNLGKNYSGKKLVGNHAVIFTEINSARIFVRSVMFVWTMVDLLKRSSPFFPGFSVQGMALVNSIFALY